MSDAKRELKRNVISGFGTLVVREFFLKIISFFGQILLARLLVPSDFGMYVILIFIINLFSLFTDVGLSLAIIQKEKDPSSIELSSVYILKVGLTIIVIGIIWLAAPYSKLFYSSFSESTILMVRLLSLILLMTSLRLVPLALLERRLQYNLISLLDVIGVFIYYIIAILLAFIHFGVWSLVWATIAKECIDTIIVYIVQPFYPSTGFSLSSIRHLIKFGIYLQGNSLINVLNSAINPVINGKINGAYAVGLIDFAYNLASVPIIIAFNFGRVAFAGYARVQSEQELLTSAITKSISMLAIVLYIFPVVILGTGKELVPLLFSAKWIPSIPALYWYSISVFCLPLIAALGQGILVIGKSKEIFWMSFFTTITGAVLALYLCLHIGYVGIAVSYTLITFAFCVGYFIIFRNAGFSFPLRILLLPKILVCGICLLFIISANHFLPNSFALLIGKLLAICVLYIGGMFILAKKDSKELFSLLSQRIISKKL